MSASLHSEVSFVSALNEARNTKAEQLDPEAAQILEKANRLLFNRLEENPKKYIMNRDEYMLLNYFWERYSDNKLAQQAVKRFWDNYKGDAKALQVSAAASNKARRQ